MHHQSTESSVVSHHRASATNPSKVWRTHDRPCDSKGPLRLGAELASADGQRRWPPASCGANPTRPEKLRLPQRSTYTCYSLLGLDGAHALYDSSVPAARTLGPRGELGAGTSSCTIQKMPFPVTFIQSILRCSETIQVCGRYVCLVACDWGGLGEMGVSHTCRTACGAAHGSTVSLGARTMGKWKFASRPV